MFKKLLLLSICFSVSFETATSFPSFLEEAQAAQRRRGVRHLNSIIHRSSLKPRPWNKTYSQFLIQEINQQPSIFKNNTPGRYCRGYNKRTSKQKRVRYWLGYFKRLIGYESGNDPGAWNRITIKGRTGENHGLLQINPALRRAYGCARLPLKSRTSLAIARNNIKCGVKMMAKLMRKHGEVTRAGKAYWEPMRRLSKRKAILKSACFAMNGRDRSLGLVSERNYKRKRRQVKPSLDPRTPKTGGYNIFQ